MFNLTTFLACLDLEQDGHLWWVELTELLAHRPKTAGCVFRCDACQSPIFLRFPIKGFSPQRIELGSQFQEVERRVHRPRVQPRQQPERHHVLGSRRVLAPQPERGDVGAGHGERDETAHDDGGTAGEPQAGYAAALARYREGHFAQALALLDPLAAGDGPSCWLAGRCRELGAGPPPTGWRPITRLATK